MKRRTVRPKFMTTEQLHAFRENGYVGKNGLDREQYQEEIDSLYYARTNKALEASIAAMFSRQEEHLDFIEEGATLL